MAQSGQPVEDQFLITVRGVAGAAVRTIFADLQVTTLDDTTVLAGVLPDQAALHGVLHRTEDLGLEVIDVRRQPARPKYPKIQRLRAVRLRRRRWAGVAFGLWRRSAVEPRLVGSEVVKAELPGVLRR
jgi:hypothetical protein